MQAHAAELLEGDGAPAYVRKALARNNIDIEGAYSLCGGSNPPPAGPMGQLPAPAVGLHHDESTDTDCYGDVLRLSCATTHL